MTSKLRFALPANLIAVWLLVASACQVLAVDPVVSRVQAKQREGSRLVDITYDVTDPDSPTLTVYLKVSADGSLTFEIRAPQGATVALETTSDLNTWVESQRITGQGDSTPVKVTLQPDPNVQAKFWRVRVR